MFCDVCQKEVDVEKISTVEEIEVKDIKVKAKIVTIRCKTCGEEIYDEKTEIQNDISVFDAYKEAKGLLKVDEIKAIRKKYNLSSENFSILLGFGKRTIIRYESGSIQDFAHDNLMRAVKNEDVVKMLLELRGKLLPTKIAESLKRKLIENEEKKKIGSFSFLMYGTLHQFSGNNLYKVPYANKKLEVTMS